MKLHSSTSDCACPDASARHNHIYRCHTAPLNQTTLLSHPHLGPLASKRSHSAAAAAATLFSIFCERTYERKDNPFVFSMICW